MKKALLILAFASVTSSIALFGQARGVAPSVTSVTRPNAGAVAPVAPSVTSPGPRGFSGPCLGVLGCTDPNFRTNVNFRQGTVEFGQRFNTHNRGGHRGNRRGEGVIYSYPYAYPVYVPVPVEQDQVEPQNEEQYEPPPLTVFDRRGGVWRAPNPTPAEPATNVGERSSAEPRESVDQNHVSPSVRELVSVIIVFKDGHEQEIGNYAIVGDTLYELGNSIAHKIKLADLDLKQTVDKNEQRGVEFSLPANFKPQA